jgi:UMP-CMP kinase
VRDYGFIHLSAGDLLRAHMKSGSADGQMVADMIANGQIVPSSVTVSLLRGAIAAASAATGARKFLVDGFPRNAENRDAWEAAAGFDCAMVLFFDVPEATMEARLLGRNEGRTDDNAATIRKRFAVFQEATQPVVAHYEGKGKVARVDGSGTPAEVYAATQPFFEKFKG